MHKRNRVISVLLIGVMLLAVGLVAGAGEKVGIVTSIGGLGDLSFNDFTYAGARWAADAMGVEIDVVEPMTIGDFEGLLRDFAIAGEYKIIVAVGFLQADALAVV
ncbi:sugar-binding protein, partial [Candidatus Bipolaricaulota bacterium]|nr:sugar-binding protein [Candidatus Bipolaricaulota bacterium]